MKTMRLLWLFSAIAILGSCSKDLTIEPEMEQQAGIVTTQATTEHFLDDFAGVPMYIYAPEGAAALREERYLTRTNLESEFCVVTVKDDYMQRYEGGIAMLPERDDEQAFTQQWYIDRVPRTNCFYIRSRLGDFAPRYIRQLMGNDLIGGHYLNAYQPLYIDPPIALTGMSLSNDPGSAYYINNIASGYSNTVEITHQSYGFSLNYDFGLEETRFDTGTPGKLSLKPAEGFYLQSVRYSLEPEDGTGLIPRPDFVDEIVFNNGSAAQQQMNIEFTRKIVEESSFQESNGGAKSNMIKAGASATIAFEAGIPFARAQTTIGASLEYQNTSQNSWNYTTSGKETREDTRAYKFTLVAPPHSSYRATISVANYNAQCTYVATFVGEHSGAQIIETGKWTGVCAGLITYNIIDLSTNRQVARILGTPDEPIDIRKVQGRTIDYRKHR